MDSGSITAILAQADLWLLFLMRASGFIVVVPVFSAPQAPMQLRIALTFALAIIAFSAWAPLSPAAALTQGELLPAALSELALGLLLGFMCTMIFMVFQFAGTFVGYQMGFSVVTVLDPSSRDQASLIGQYFFVVAMLVFLQLNLHHDLLRLWYQSYEIAPVGGWALENLQMSSMVAAFDDLLLLSLKISLPLLAFMMLTDLALGITARVVPQLNVFIVGMPLKIAIGLFFMSLVVLQFDPVVRKVTYAFVNDAGMMLKSLSGG